MAANIVASGNADPIHGVSSHRNSTAAAMIAVVTAKVVEGARRFELIYC